MLSSPHTRTCTDARPIARWAAPCVLLAGLALISGSAFGKSTATVIALDGTAVEVVASHGRVGLSDEVQCSYLVNGSTNWRPDRLASRLDMAATAAEHGQPETIVERDDPAVSAASPMMSGLTKVCSCEIVAVGRSIEITTWGTFQKSETVSISPGTARRLAGWLRAVATGDAREGTVIAEQDAVVAPAANDGSEDTRASSTGVVGPPLAAGSVLVRPADPLAPADATDHGATLPVGDAITSPSFQESLLQCEMVTSAVERLDCYDRLAQEVRRSVH